MAITEKISMALPPEMVDALRSAVVTGEYASSSEVVSDALRDWTYKRSLRQQGIAELRSVWCEALQDKRPGCLLTMFSIALSESTKPWSPPPAWSMMLLELTAFS